MQFCTAHWDQLRAAIETRGLSGLVAPDGKTAVENLQAELVGNVDSSNYDPLMGCHNMISSKALEFGGLYLLGNDPSGNQYCPVCEVKTHLGDEAELDFIEGPADAVLRHCQKEGLVPTIQ